MASSRLHCFHQILNHTIQLQRCQGTITNLQTVQPQLIQVSPPVSLFDQKVHIRLQGLPSNAKVTLHAKVEQKWQQKQLTFASYSHLVASQTGDVDLSKDASLGGTYTGVDPMGLFWSLRPSPSGPQNIRLVVRNVEEPLHYVLSLYSDHISLKDIISTEIYKPLCVTIATRFTKAANVRRVPVREGSIRGTLFLPPGDGPHPGVIDMFGSSGGIVEMRAALLASHGFAALALPYFRFEDLPARLEDVQFEYFEEAARWLIGQGSVKKHGIGVIGISKGAELALMMAWQCPEVAAAVQINGHPFYILHDLMHKGKVIIEGLVLDPAFAVPTAEGLDIRDAHHHYKPEHIIPVWESNAHILTLVSDDDRQQNPALGEVLYNRYPPEKQHLVEVVHYPGAGHLLEPPYTPFCRASINPSYNINMLWGGNPKEHAKSQEDSWQRILQFLKKHL